eukprot:2199411-Rhodomonas_salina.1
MCIRDRVYTTHSARHELNLPCAAESDGWCGRVLLWRKVTRRPRPSLWRSRTFSAPTQSPSASFPVPSTRSSRAVRASLAAC